MTPAQIIAIIMLLQAFGVNPQTVAQIQGYLQPAPITQATSPMTENTPTPSTPDPALTAPATQARIEIVSPISGKGLGRQYMASQNITGEANYLEIGAVLYDENGDPVSDQEVRVTVEGPDGNDDAMRAKRMVGTGDIMTSYASGAKRQIPIYSYHYEFNVAGEHTITFTSASGKTASVTVTAK